MGGTKVNIWQLASQGDVSGLKRILEDGHPDIEINQTNKLGEACTHFAAKNGRVR
jgi:hypothetical protein